MNLNNVVPFKTDEGISQELLNDLLEQGRQYGITDISPFGVDRINVAEWVHLKCRYGCNKFGTSWCCPPATPTTEEAKKILGEYSLALLLTGSKQHSDFYLNNGRKRGVQVKTWKGMLGIERNLFLEGYYKAFSLVGEGCALCKECAYPEACRFPQEKRPSVESFSIDVIGTLNNLGIQMKVATDVGDSFKYYGIILLE